jgi:hypothetical protein
MACGVAAVLAWPLIAPHAAPGTQALRRFLVATSLADRVRLSVRPIRHGFHPWPPTPFAPAGPGIRLATRSEVRNGPQAHPGASPEVRAPSALGAVPPCPGLPSPGRSRFSVRATLAGFRCAAFTARVVVHDSASLCDLPPIPCPASPGLHHRSTAALATQIIHRRFLRGRCSRPVVAVRTALPRATHPRRHSWGSALRSVAPACKSRRVSKPLNPPAVS